MLSMGNVSNGFLVYKKEGLNILERYLNNCLFVRWDYHTGFCGSEVEFSNDSGFFVMMWLRVKSFE